MQDLAYLSGNDTIAAISTAVSEAGIGIVRISGPLAISSAQEIFHPALKTTRLHEVSSHTIHYGHIYDGDEMVDEVLVSVFRAPKSYTAEDVVEINCHGGVYALRRVLQTVLQTGVRVAEPGEFTKRAFLNGRIDLSRAEAVMDVIRAKNELALRSGVKQLKGSLFTAIKLIRDDILTEYAYMEASLDDPEHYTLDGFAESLALKTRSWCSTIEALVGSSERGKIIKEGIRCAIVGIPNAGKSSLMNLLTGEERAIVTELAGTTRDVLTEEIRIGSIVLQLADTAGIRETQDRIERLGVDRALLTMDQADLILYVVDSSRAFTKEDELILEKLEGKNAIILLNKTDLDVVVTTDQMKNMASSFPVIPISAKEKTGLKALEKAIEDLFFEGNIHWNDEIIITNERQIQCLEKAEKSLKQVLETLSLNLPEDVCSIDLMDACDALGEITGDTVRDDLISTIFEKFCMGK